MTFIYELDPYRLNLYRTIKMNFLHLRQAIALQCHTYRHTRCHRKHHHAVSRFAKNTKTCPTPRTSSTVAVLYAHVAAMKLPAVLKYNDCTANTRNSFYSRNVYRNWPNDWRTDTDTSRIKACHKPANQQRAHALRTAVYSWSVTAVWNHGS